MEYLQLTMDEFLQEEQGIKEELGSMAKSFVRTGWRLSRIDRSGAYKIKGYKSITEYAKVHEAEKELEEYLSCDGLPERTILKEQLITGGLRLIRNLVLDVIEEGDEL